MKSLRSFLLLLAVSVTAAASDTLRDAQAELKSQGFYYGEVNGSSSTETTAALRRYQIRNGLEVTGELNAQTLKSLGIGGVAAKPSPRPAPIPEHRPEPPPAPATRRADPPVNLRRDDSTEESDRVFLRREESRGTPPALPPPSASSRGYIPPPAPIPVADADYESIFERTPYGVAPREVQEQTLRRAQSILAQRGYYRAPIDGLPGPSTTDAIVSYQRRTRLPVTGRLDLATLNELRLLPGRTSPQPFFSRPSRTDTRIYRGVIVD